VEGRQRAAMLFAQHSAGKAEGNICSKGESFFITDYPDMILEAKASRVDVSSILYQRSHFCHFTEYYTILIFLFFLAVIPITYLIDLMMSLLY
ncbi:MAG: hypothetical protein F6K39_13125, partial [Okeania sp. SIO3B3]|nr:hypothetical protein [Okeania sp. SIO3B3]